MAWGRKNKYYNSSRSGIFGRSRRTSLVHRPRKSFRINGYLLLNGIMVLGILGIAGYLVFSPKYKVSHIEVNGLSYVTPTEFLEFINQELDSQMIAWIHQRNIFLTSSKSLRSAIESRYLFNDLTIKKLYPDTIRFEVKEKNVVYRVRSADHEYLIDDRGEVVEQFRNFNQRPNLLQLTDATVTAQAAADQDPTKNLVTFDDKDQFPLLYLQDDKGYQLGQEIMTPDQQSFIKDLLANKTVPYGEISLVMVPAANPEFLTIRMKDGWLALINTRDTLDSQFQDMKLVIEQKIGPDKLKRLDRIDLRLGENVYFKMR